MKRLFLFLVAAVLTGLPAAVHADTAKPGWTEDATAALKSARAEKKLLLMDFTGSDWCPFCVKLDKEVFSTPEFKDYAKNNLVLLELDFPKNKTQKRETIMQNEQIREMFGVEGFPVLIVCDSTGKPLEAIRGVAQTKALIAELNKLKG